MFQNSSQKPLTRWQKKALKALSGPGVASLDDICRTAGIRPSVFARWMHEDRFCQALARNQELSRRLSNILLVGSLPRVLTQFGDLLYAPNPETIRKSCADYFRVIAEADKRDAQAAAREKNTKPAPPEIITDPEQVNRAFEAVFGKDFNKTPDQFLPQESPMPVPNPLCR